MTTSAHALFQTMDCLFPGCPAEADRGSDRCSHHRHATVVNDRDRLSRMFADDRPASALTVGQAVRVLNGHSPTIEEDTSAVEDSPRCKIDGCTSPSAGKGGSWHGLCSTHIAIEGRRRQQIAKDRRRGSVKPPPAAPTTAEPVAGRPVSDHVHGLAAKAARLAHLGLEIEQTRERLTDLQGEAFAILDELREQVAA